MALKTPVHLTLTYTESETLVHVLSELQAKGRTLATLNRVRNKLDRAQEQALLDGLERLRVPAGYR